MVDVMEGNHYHTCRALACDGCLPTISSMQFWTLIEYWAEMLKRGIPQTEETQHYHGACSEAIIKNGQTYILAANHIRQTALDEENQRFGM